MDHDLGHLPELPRAPRERASQGERAAEAGKSTEDQAATEVTSGRPMWDRARRESRDAAGSFVARIPALLSPIGGLE
jgi:hypothetical protein